MGSMSRSDAGRLGAIKRAKNVKQRYIENPNLCKYCSSPLPYDKRNNKFCNKSCAASHNNVGVRRHGRNTEEKTCINCHKKYSARHKDSKYCSNLCNKQYIRNAKISEWMIGSWDGITDSGYLSDYVRTYLFEKYENKCSICGWGEKNEFTGKIPLEVEHIDGNHLNNRPENLTLLCPNCHSLTKTYKGANRGMGRYLRRKRYAEGKSF